MIFALPAEGDTDLTMRIFNSDGSEPEMCGNGIRCLARFVSDVDKSSPRKYRIHTLAGGRRAACDPSPPPHRHAAPHPGPLPRCCAGLIIPELLPDGQVKVDMGPPILEGPKVPTTLAPTQGSTVVQQVRGVHPPPRHHTAIEPVPPHASGEALASPHTSWRLVTKPGEGRSQTAAEPGSPGRVHCAPW